MMMGLPPPPVGEVLQFSVWSGVEATDVLTKPVRTESATGNVPPEVAREVTDTGLGQVHVASSKLEPVPHELTIKLNTGEQSLMDSQGPKWKTFSIGATFYW